jgi:hypothetical protein
MVFAPLEGWRHVKVSDRHTAIDYAHTLRDLSDLHFPDAAKIVFEQFEACPTHNGYYYSGTNLTEAP